MLTNIVLVFALALFAIVGASEAGLFRYCAEAGLPVGLRRSRDAVGIGVEGILRGVCAVERLARQSG